MLFRPRCQFDTDQQQQGTAHEAPDDGGPHGEALGGVYGSIRVHVGVGPRYALIGVTDIEIESDDLPLDGPNTEKEWGAKWFRHFHESARVGR